MSNYERSGSKNALVGTPRSGHVKGRDVPSSFVSTKTQFRSNFGDTSEFCLIDLPRLDKKKFEGLAGKESKKNHGTQDSRVVPHRGTNWAALWLTAQIGRDAVLSESYGRGYWFH